ncbi:MAG: ATP-binding protein, partial [Spirochaetota bacterium]
ARQAIQHMVSTERAGYSSLYSKLTLILLAMALYMTLQAFSFAGSAVSLSQLEQLHPQPGREGFMTAPELLSQARRFAGLKDLLGVFFFKALALGGFIVQLLYQLKRLIARPIATIQDRLEALNSSDPTAGRVIDIVQNDEFAVIFTQLNDLIGKQQGRLETSERRLNDIVSGAADPILAFDRQRRVVLYNPAAMTLFGYTSEAVLGSGLDIFLGERERVLVPGDASLVRLPWQRADGTTVLMESHLATTGMGDDAWTTVILRDISRQAELEETLRKARIEAENASRMKSEFLANMSHELRTPMNAVLGFAQLIENDRNLTSTQRDRLRIISRSGEHLLDLINDILDISKIEAGKMQLHESVFDLPELIGDLHDMFELKCRKKGLSLYIDTIEELPRHVRGDLGKLRQVLVNLLGNAVKFTAEGGVGILVGRDNDGIRFTIRDTGRGIPEEEQEAILQPFMQASTTDHEGGTGLGLAISSRFVAMLGGRLSVTSKPGEGSEFSFTIALPPAESAPIEKELGNLDFEVDTGTLALVVDDQEANRIVLKAMLEQIGFSVIEAKNGQEALDRTIDEKPGLVFMDIKMPVMDGYEAVSAIRADPAIMGCHVFALTASAFNHDRERIEAAGFDGFLAKPFKQNSLYRLILEKGGLDVKVRTAPPQGLPPSNEAGKPGEPTKSDFMVAAKALGTDGIHRLETAVGINDFTGLQQICAGLVMIAPSLAATLDAAAASFDEVAVQALLEKITTAAPESGETTATVKGTIRDGGENG